MLAGTLASCFGGHGCVLKISRHVQNRVYRGCFFSFPLATFWTAASPQRVIFQSRR